MVKLSDKDRPVSTIELEDKTFVIRKVVTGVYRRYGQFAADSGEVISQLGNLQKQIEEGDPDKVTAIQEQLQEMNTVAEQMAQQRESMEHDCIEMILSRNGYEMDWQWWIDNTDMTDRQAFIVECLNKDTQGGSKKKADALTGQE